MKCSDTIYNGSPWEWRTLGVADPGSGGPWEWWTLGVVDPGSGGPWEWWTLTRDVQLSIIKTLLPLLGRGPLMPCGP